MAELAKSIREIGALASGTAASRSTAFPRASTPPRASRLLSASVVNKSFGPGASDSAVIALARNFLTPTVVIAVLAACMLVARQRFSVASFGLACVAFLLSERIFSKSELCIGPIHHAQVRPALHRLIFEWSCVCVLLAFLAMTLGFTQLLPRSVALGWFLITPVAVMLANIGTLRLVRWWTGRRPNARRHIIIGATDAGIELAKRVREHGGIAGQFLGFFDFRDPARLPELNCGHSVRSCDDVANFVRQHAIEVIYIALPISSSPRITHLLEQLRDTTASIYYVPNIIKFELVQPRCIQIHGMPALAVCETPHQGLCGLHKRVADIVLAACALVLAAPVMVAIAVAVRLTSHGPVLFKQRRYGLNGEEIFIYKFRTMTVCEDGQVVNQATQNDQRVTPLGRILRRTSLDELPQILNVLEGKMSVVGPRPHAVAHNELYRRLISGYMIRHKVRPGITGWAQINGLRGETDTTEKMRRRIEYDIDYINNWSLWLDLKILLRTLLLVVHDHHAY